MNFVQDQLKTNVRAPILKRFRMIQTASLCKTFGKLFYNLAFFRYKFGIFS